MTFGTTIPLLLQEGTEGSASAWGMVTGASGLTQAVLVLLALLSLVSWGVMLHKALEFRQARAAGNAFMHDFEHAHTLGEVASAAQRVPPSGFTRVFERAQQFLSETTPA